MRTLFLTILFLTMPFAAVSQRAYRPVKEALKAKNYKAAIEKINLLRSDSVHRDAPKLCVYGIEAYQGLNDAENMKIYLKKSYDTIAFFSTTRQIVNEAMRLDSIEREQAAVRTNYKFKYRDFVSEHLRRYYPNLNAAARYFYKKRKFNETMPYLRLCLDLPYTEAGREVRLSAGNHLVNACLYLTSAFNAKQIAEVHRYEELALKDSLARQTILECLVYTAEMQKDTLAYVRRLNEGWKDYPSQPMFFTRLVDYYTHKSQYNKVLNIASEQLRRDSTDQSALLAFCISHLQLAHFDECIASGLRLLKVDSANVEANYYIGASYVAKASCVELPENAFSLTYRKSYQQRKEYYLKAEPFLEKYREQMPQLTNRWAPLLYKVYLGLNRGKKFAEIEKLL